MIEGVLGALLFTAIVMTLVAAVLLARAWLAPSGSAIVTINGEHRVEVPRGETLLAGLRSGGIRLPAGCGGKGTCGQCRVEVRAGAGSALPTERALLARREVDRGVRLACQLVVQDAIAIGLPDELLGVESFVCSVRRTRFVATLIKEITFELPDGHSLGGPAGRYLLVTCPPYRLRYRDLEVDAAVRDEWDRLGVWGYEAGSAVPTTRAYSLASFPGEKGIAMFLVRLALPPPAAPDAPPGVVSSWLFGLREGDIAELSGPYGHFFVEEGPGEILFVGGGAGMAPMRAHIFDQLLRLRTRRKLRFFYGARHLRELFYADDFDRLQAEHPNFEWTPALSEPRPDDAWDGETGFIHEVLYRRYLVDHPAPEDCDYYLCGPPLMVRAVRGLLDQLGVDPDRIRADDFGTAG